MNAGDSDDSGPMSGVEEGFLQRFHRRKLAARRGERLPDEPQLEATVPVRADEPEPAEPEVLLTDDDMPPIESLSKDSDFSGFLSPGVSEDLRRAALRRLWLVADTPFTDDLDVYAGDYTQFESLGGLITREMKHRLDVEVRRRAEAAAEAVDEQPETEDAQSKSVAAEPAVQADALGEQEDAGPGAAADPEWPDEESLG